MRDWTLGPSDPMAFTLSADFRLCTTDYVNDHIWELETRSGDPPALVLRTTYGLRARSMRIFPRFTKGSRILRGYQDSAVTDPATFSIPPRVHSFYPNFLSLDFSPFLGIDVVAEYWVPDSHTSAGRFTVTNRSGEPVSILLELCGQLAPLEGQGLAAISMQSVNILVGRSSNITPVIFLTGGPQPGLGPHPSLALDLTLPVDGVRTLTWVQAALKTPEESLEQARRTAARPWEAERTKLELVNAAQTVEVCTGDPDWDTAFALSQKTAFNLFIGTSRHLPFPSFVLARQPDQGYSQRGDGSDYSYLWSRQSPLEAYYLASLLPGAPELAAGLVRNFLANLVQDGTVEWKTGPTGQREHWLAAPFIASLAWQTYQRAHDLDFLREVHPKLNALLSRWFNEQHDRDGDGFPEWDHPLQTGFEDNPAFTVWQTGGQGAEISAVESPALASLLYHEFKSMANIADALGLAQEREQLELKLEELRLLVDECWDSDSGMYLNRDRDTHRSPAGKFLGNIRGPGTLTLDIAFQQPFRLLVRIEIKGETTRRPEVTLHGSNGDTSQTEALERMDFRWGASLAVATSHKLYTKLSKVVIAGVEKRDRIFLQIMDFSGKDITLLLPLWAGIPNLRRARTLTNRMVFAANYFGRPFGIPACISSAYSLSSGDMEEIDPIRQAVHLPWNALIGEGLLAYGLHKEAVQLTVRLMSAVIQNLKKQHAFARAYHSETGIGIGERNAVEGLAPLGLFLSTLGVQIESPLRVILRGKNPFPWQVTVKYRGLAVTRQAEQTVVVFPDGQTVTLKDPTEAIVSAE